MLNIFVDDIDLFMGKGLLLYGIDQGVISSIENPLQQSSLFMDHGILDLGHERSVLQYSIDYGICTLLEHHSLSRKIIYFMELHQSVDGIKHQLVNVFAQLRKFQSITLRKAQIADDRSHRIVFHRNIRDGIYQNFEGVEFNFISVISSFIIINSVQSE